MARKFKNSDDSTYYTDKAIEQKLEKLRYELIEGYAGRKGNNYNKKPKKGRKKLFDK